MRLRVQLWHKLAYPLMAVVMAAYRHSFCAFYGYAEARSQASPWQLASPSPTS